MAGKRLNNGLGEANGAVVAGFGFGPGADDDADPVDAVDSVSDGEGAAVQVDVFPAQAEDFGAAQAQGKSDSDDGFQAIAFDGFQQAPNLVAGRCCDFASGGARHGNQLGGITDDVAAFDGEIQGGAQASQSGLARAEAAAA